MRHRFIARIRAAWKTVAIVVMVVGVWYVVASSVFRRGWSHRDEAREPLRLWLVAEGARENLPVAKEALRSRSVPEFDVHMRKLRDSTDVMIDSLEMRGSWMGNAVFRVEYRVGGADSSHGKKVRYFEMERTPLMGWDGVPSESSEFIWKVAPFR